MGSASSQCHFAASSALPFLLHVDFWSEVSENERSTNGVTCVWTPVVVRNAIVSTVFMSAVGGWGYIIPEKWRRWESRI
jgi:hypothetical protein